MRLFALFFTLVSAVSAAPIQETFVNEVYDLEKLSENVYSFIAPQSDSGVVQGNCTFIIGEESVLVFDTGQFPSLAKRMVADIQRITPKPVRFIVNSHWHFDHNWGNAVFREAYPSVAIISTKFTRELIASEGPKVLSKQAAVNSQQAADLRKLIADGKFSDGRPISDESKRSLKRSADTLEHINAELPLTVNTPPNVAFEKELTLNLGKREVKVLWLGRANTAGDAVLWLPDAKLLLAGDTVVYPAPFAFGSYISEWPATLHKMIDLQPATIVPGHGPVMHDTAYMQTIAEIFQELSTQARAAVAQKLSFEDIRKKISADDFAKRLPGGSAEKNPFFSTFLYGAVDRAYQEATGKLKPENED